MATAHRITAYASAFLALYLPASQWMDSPTLVAGHHASCIMGHRTPCSPQALGLTIINVCSAKSIYRHTQSQHDGPTSTLKPPALHHSKFVSSSSGTTTYSKKFMSRNGSGTLDSRQPNILPDNPPAIIPEIVDSLPSEVSLDILDLPHCKRTAGDHPLLTWLANH
ncbi:hypothetical protein PAXINDRAFT_16919 [Paxillus involutus ATCC 200175]|uniref:Uncharacterized protein n=1 Tax=Paxillus involutus ATCC 200175 TaxID=664439 RepID=A0A0C9SQY2_PAXIN|nr:hypothetical protein PAXINDRAFT_16919 [Paxillus involutus ATCC 200175]